MDLYITVIQQEIARIKVLLPFLPPDIANTVKVYLDELTQALHQLMGEKNNE